VYNTTYGNLVLQGNGTYVYTPDTNYFGIDSFIYEVCNDEPVVECIQATVYINVIPVNDVIIARDDTAQGYEEMVLNGSSLMSNDGDPDGSIVSINTTATYGPNHGQLVINTDGTYIYTPDSN
jgi:hypothetical protein